MWWRLLGVAVVLLGLGGAIGYAVADDSQESPRSGGAVEPIPAESPSVPTPPVYSVFPDPTAPPLAAGVETETEELRITKRGAGISLSVPIGWARNRQENSQVWTFTPDINTRNTYTLRVNLLIGQHVAVEIAKQTRLAALRSAEEGNNLKDLDVTVENDTGFEASYIDEGYQRVSLERFLGDENQTAYADIAVTGRTVDQEGMRDLLARVTESVTQLDALPPKSEESP